MVTIKAIRIVFVASGYVDFGGTDLDYKITKKFIRDSENVPTDDELLDYANFVSEHSVLDKIVSRETYEIKLSMTFNEFYKFAHVDNIKKKEI